MDNANIRDIQGGIRMVYSIEQTADSKDKGRTLEEDRVSAIRTLSRRAQTGLGVVEANVYGKGLDQIVVELPGFTDIEDARDMMGSTARLLAYHAKNITTSKRPKLYSIG